MRRAGSVDDPGSWRRAQFLLAVQAAAGVALGVLLVAVVTYVVAVSQLDADLSARLEQAAHAGDLADPPPGIWLVEIGPDGVHRASRTAPPGVLAPERIAASTSHPTIEEVHLGPGREYLVWTGRIGARTLRAGIDYQRREDEQHRLLLGLAVAGAIATLVAAGSGTLLARRAMAPLHQAVARQRRFVADASHELRTPLSRLALRAELLRRDLRSGVDPTTLDQDGQALVEQAHQLSEFMDDLLLTAQLGGDPRAGDLVDLARLVGRVADVDRHRAAEHSVTLTARITPVPPVRGVAPALVRAVSALVDNALRYAGPGGHVALEVAPDGPDGVRLTVTDDGPGIDPAVSDRLFGRLVHGGGGRHGIGLSLVHEVVQAHHGTIELEPGDMPGARFVLRFPGARR